MNRRSFLTMLGVIPTCPLPEWRFGDTMPRGPALLDRFKLGVISDELSPDLEEALKIMKGYGLGWVEIRTVWNTYNTEATPEQIRRMKDLLEKYQFKVSVVDTAFLKCDLPGTKNVVGEKDVHPYAAQMDLLKRAIDRAHALRTDKLRVFAFWRVADPEPHFPRIAEELTKAAELARGAGVRLLLEDEGSCNVGCARELARMLSLVKAANFGANWDVGNGYWHGEVSYPDGYSLLDKKRIGHVHLKDVRCGDTATAQKHEAWRKNAVPEDASKCHTALVGEGQVNLLGHLQALLKDGYDGTMSLEPEYEAPGVSRLQATRRSLEALLKLMEQARASTFDTGLWA